MVALILSGIICTAVLWFLLRPASVPAVLGFAQLTRDGHLKSGPLFTDERFVYFLEPDNGKTRLVRVPVGGGEPTTLLTMPTTIDQLYDFSPSRHELLMPQWVGATDKGQPLWVCDVPGGPCRRLGGVTATAAAWSPTDDRIFYAQGGKVFSAKSDGSDPRELFSIRGVVLCMSSSPDGRLLRYVVEKTDTNIDEFWEVRTDRGRARLVFSDVRSDFHDHGMWTQDAKYIFFT